jgi:tungstate transport system substrate-binding protein
MECSLRRLRVLALIALCFVLPALAACTDPGPPDDRLTPGAEATAAARQPTSPATTAGTAPAPTPDFRGVTANIGGAMVLATTWSPLDSGLLDVLAPLFTKLTGTEVQVIGVSTNQELAMAAKGTADAVLIDSPSDEKQAVDNGELVNGKLVMHNDFIILGPASDPAKIRGQRDLSAVMKAIAATGPFVSRGDDSATNRTELALWQAAGIDPKTVKGRSETGQGSGATLVSASQKDAYTITDRATYLALQKSVKLDLLFENDPSLLSIYHVYSVSPDRHPGAKKAQADAWVNFMVAPATQQIIGEFKKTDAGQALYTPDAGKVETSIGR